MMNQIIEKLRSFFRHPVPEEKVRASLDTDELLVSTPDGNVNKMPRDAIQQIAIQTTSTGPFVEDVYWAISDPEMTVFVPQASPDFSNLLNEFQKLPNFNNDRFSEAMCCAEDRLFVCWERNTEQAAPQGRR